MIKSKLNPLIIEDGFFEMKVKIKSCEFINDFYKVNLTIFQTYTYDHYNVSINVIKKMYINDGYYFFLLNNNYNKEMNKIFMYIYEMILPKIEIDKLVPINIKTKKEDFKLIDGEKIIKSLYEKQSLFIDKLNKYYDLNLRGELTLKLILNENFYPTSSKIQKSFNKLYKIVKDTNNNNVKEKIKFKNYIKNFHCKAYENAFKAFLEKIENLYNEEVILDLYSNTYLGFYFKFNIISPYFDFEKQKPLYTLLLYLEILVDNKIIQYPIGYTDFNDLSIKLININDFSKNLMNTSIYTNLLVPEGFPNYKKDFFNISIETINYKIRRFLSNVKNFSIEDIKIESNNSENTSIFNYNELIKDGMILSSLTTEIERI